MLLHGSSSFCSGPCQIKLFEDRALRIGAVPLGLQEHCANAAISWCIRRAISGGWAINLWDLRQAICASSSAYLCSLTWSVVPIVDEREHEGDLCDAAPATEFLEHVKDSRTNSDTTDADTLNDGTCCSLSETSSLDSHFESSDSGSSTPLLPLLADSQPFDDIGETEVLLKKQQCDEECRGGIGKPIKIVHQNRSLYFSAPICEITFEPLAGPLKLDLLTVKVKAGVLNADNVAPCLHALTTWISNGALQRDFLAVFDISAMIRPSVFDMPQLSRLFGEHAGSLWPFREYQQCFAVIRGNSFLFNKFVDNLVRLSKAETVPIFAADLEASVELMRQRLLQDL